MLAVVEEKETKDVQIEVQSLINEFEGITPKQLPRGLPSLSDVQHRIEIVVGILIY